MSSAQFRQNLGVCSFWSSGSLCNRNRLQPGYLLPADRLAHFSKIALLGSLGLPICCGFGLQNLSVSTMGCNMPVAHIRVDGHGCQVMK